MISKLNVSFTTPLIIRWPEKIRPGSVENEMAQNLVFAQTLLTAAGIHSPNDIQGESLMPLLLREKENREICLTDRWGKDIRITAADTTPEKYGDFWTLECRVMEGIVTTHPWESSLTPYTSAGQEKCSNWITFKYKPGTEIRMLGVEVPLSWKAEGDKIIVNLPSEKPCEHAFVLKMELD